jgi:hypothetical protein
MKVIWRGTFLVFSLLITLGAGPGEPSPPVAVTSADRETALSLLKLTGAEAQMIRMIEAMKPGVAAMILLKVPGPDGQKLVEDILMPELRNHIGGLTATIAEAYVKHFTAAEMAEMLNFYAGPIGRKMVAEQAAIAGESQQIGAAWVQSILPVIFREHADELAAISMRAQQRTANPPSADPFPPRQ